MSDLHHRRIVVLGYFQKDLPKFETKEEHDEWLRAVGYMVTYGMGQDASEEQLELVTAGITHDPLELGACYHARVPAYDVKNPAGERIYYKGNAASLDGALDPLIGKAGERHRPFVMGAVKHASGKISFHS